MRRLITVFLAAVLALAGWTNAGMGADSALGSHLSGRIRRRLTCGSATAFFISITALPRMSQGLHAARWGRSSTSRHHAGNWRIRIELA